MTARLLTEARVEGRAQRCWRSMPRSPRTARCSTAPKRAELDQGRARLETAIAGEDRDEINAAAEALETLSKPFAERRMDRGIREALSGKSVKRTGEPGSERSTE